MFWIFLCENVEWGGGNPLGTASFPKQKQTKSPLAENDPLASPYEVHASRPTKSLYIRDSIISMVLI